MKAYLVALAAGMAAACGAHGAAASADDVVRFVARPGVIEFSGTMIARPRPGLTDAERNAAIDRLLPLLDRQYPEVDEFVIRVPGADGTGLAENVLSQELMATGWFQYVEPNWICYPTVIPNDPQYGSQWHLPVIGAPETWDITQGTSNIVLAFTDTGVDLNHPDLMAHRLPGYNAVVELPETSGGQVNDLNGHGTHVAGIACAIGNNGQGVAGATWDTRFMMIRVSDSSSGGSSIEVLTRAARWAAENGAHSVSTSYTGINSTSIDTTGDYIRGLGKLYLYAADNSATNHSSFDWLNVIIVGATDVGDTRASFSSYGRAVDIFAPGVNILSTCNGSGYCSLSGTSMATPLANGVIGAVLSANPALTADMVEQIISETAVDLGPPGNDDAWGWGRVNMLQAVQRAVALSGPLAPFATDDNAGHKIIGESATLDVLSNDFDLNQGDSIVLDTFEATTALGGTVVRSVGTGPGGRDELIYTAPNATGADSFTYTVRDTTDRTDTATVSITVVDSSFFRDPDAGPGGEPGLETAYYDGAFVFLPNFGTLTPYLTEITPAINFPSSTGNFAGSGRSDNVAATFEGYVDIPATDLYTIYLASDDGSKLYLGDDLLIANDFTHNMLERSAQVAMKAGRHAIRVEYFERFNSAGLVVSLASASMPKAPIAADLWSHGDDAGCPADLSGSSDPNDPAYGVPDGAADAADFFYYLDQFVAGNLAEADLTGSSDPNDPSYGVPDGAIDATDFFYFLDLFVQGC